MVLPLSESNPDIFPRLRSTSLLTPYQPKTNGEKRLIEILLILSLVVIAVILVYYFTNPSSTHIIGYQLVNNANGGPQEIPANSIFPFYAKPVTYLFAAGIVAGYCLFSLGQGKISTKFPRWLRAFLLLACVLLLAIGLYEVIFTFTYWGAVIVNHADPDTAVLAWPYSSVTTNLTFATKIDLLWAILAFFGTMTFKKSLDSS